MILPNNGKVIVFDDKPRDIESLLKALSKERIPFLYYQDEAGNDLPDIPIENVRLVFLDLELVVNNPSPHNIISPIAARLKRTITKNNAYVLVYWSTKEDTYRKTLETAFEDGLKDFKPVKILSLNKAEANANVNPIEYVRQALQREMKEFSSINAFMLWESSVNESAGKITNEVTSFINKSEWDKGLYGLLFRLSNAQAGADVVEEQANNSRLSFAFDLINDSLVETTQRQFIGRLKDLEIGDIKLGGRDLSPEEKLKLNTKLHLVSNDNLQHFYSGNLYIESLNAVGREIVLRNIKAVTYPELNKDKIRSISLDVTPSCDYAQNKYYTRVLFGIMVESKGSIRKQLKDSDGRYRGDLMFDIDKESSLIFDFRTLRSFTKEEFIYKFKAMPKYRLRNSLLLDIQAQLANHINRPGIVSV